MSTKTQNPNAEKYNPIVPQLTPKVQREIQNALSELKKENNKFDSLLKRSVKEYALSYVKRCRILDNIKEKTKMKYDKLSELTEISVSYIKTFAQLSKAINDAKEKSVDEFILINEQRISEQKEAKYSVHHLISYLKGNDIFSNVISDADEGKEQKKGAKEPKQSKAKEQTKEQTKDANRQTFVFNPLLFGFDVKEDVNLSITHSPKNKNKPYLIVSSINSGLLRKMFEKILFELGKCERDLEEVEKAKNKSKQEAIQDMLETETELADDVTLDTFESEFIQVRR